VTGALVAISGGGNVYARSWECVRGKRGLHSKWDRRKNLIIKGGLRIAGERK